jgi:predicted O-methyltransferase YrrM
MDQGRALWEAVDAEIGRWLLGADPALEAAQADAEAAGMPPISVSPAQGKLLGLLVRAIGARFALEIGTLAGYSAIWIGRALAAGGRLVSLEVVDRHAAVARANLARAGLGDVVDVRVGPALRSLADLHAELDGDQLDFVFVDADKANNPAYFAWAVDHCRVGGLIVVDNVVRGGALVDPAATDPDAVATRRLYETVAAEPRVAATALQTVGVKGYDGLLVALKTGSERPAARGGR